MTSFNLAGKQIFLGSRATEEDGNTHFVGRMAALTISQYTFTMQQVREGGVCPRRAPLQRPLLATRGRWRVRGRS